MLVRLLKRRVCPPCPDATQAAMMQLQGFNGTKTIERHCQSCSIPLHTAHGRQPCCAFMHPLPI